MAAPCSAGLPPTLTLALALTPTVSPTLTLTLTLSRRDDLVAPSRAILKEGALTKMRRHKWASQQCHRSPRQASLCNALLVVHSLSP